VLTLTGDTVSNNSFVHSGGGIGTNGTLTVTNSTYSRKTRRTWPAAPETSARRIRSASYIQRHGDRDHSTVSGNLACGRWGHLPLTAASMTLSNSTVSGNRGSAGAGIFNIGQHDAEQQHGVGHTADNGGGGIITVGQPGAGEQHGVRQFGVTALLDSRITWECPCRLVAASAIYVGYGAVAVTTRSSILANSTGAETATSRLASRLARKETTVGRRHVARRS